MIRLALLVMLQAQLSATPPETTTIRPSAPPAGAISALARGLQASDGAPAVVNAARLDPREAVNFRGIVTPDTVYVGQQATYQVGVFLSDAVRSRLRRNPEFVPPELRSILAYDLPSPSSAPRRTEGGVAYEVHVFQRALFPLTAGKHVIPAARLNYSMPFSTSFFSREESHTLRSAPLTLVVVEPPLTGRPADYGGAVGALALSAKLDASAGRVGDPLLLTVTVNGAGNVNFLPRPALRVQWGDAVAGAERVHLDSSTVQVRGRKEFDWVITPDRAGRLELPAIRYPYFNPYTERYEIALTTPTTLTIIPGALATTEAAPSDLAPLLPLRTVYRGSLGEPIPMHTAYWLALLLAPLPAIAIAALRRPRPTRRAAAIDQLRQFALGGGTADASELRRTYARAIADRIHASSSVLADHAIFVRTLRRAGVTRETARDADLLLAELDAAVFGRQERPSGDTARRAHRIVVAIDEEARTRDALATRLSRAGAIGLTVVSMLSLGGAVQAVAGEVLIGDGEARALFNQGVERYQSRDFAGAVRSFASLAERAPRAADAWANLGTAGWQGNDTASAVVGWQRALRLEPLAADVRERLEITPAFRPGLFGDVPPLPLDAIAIVGGALWLLACALFALAASRPSRTLRRAALGSATTAAGCALVGLLVHEIVTGKHAAVVIDAQQLRMGPALGAERGSETVTGEVARTTGRESVWTRLRFQDGREGWIETARIRFLGDER